MKTRDSFKKSGDSTQYKSWRNKVQQIIKYAKKSYYRDVINNNERNPKKLWNHLKELSGFRSHHSCETALTSIADKWKNAINNGQLVDDTTLTVVGNNKQEISSELQSVLSKIEDWCKHNYMTANVQKTKAMFISSRGTNKDTLNPSPLTFNNETVEYTESEKLLGVHVSKNAMNLTTCALVLAIVLHDGQGQTMEDTQNILTTILSGYSADVRPASNQSLPVQVNVTMELVNIKEFDEVSEQISVVIIMYLTWMDSRLTWDPLEFNGTSNVNIPVTKIWRPSLILKSPVGKIIPVGVDQDWAVVRCLYDGRIMWNPTETTTSSCNIDVSYFPFDEQFCTLIFIPWGYQTHEILLKSHEEKVRQTFYSENGGWTLVDSLVISEDVLEGYFSQYAVTFHLKRRSIFFLVNAVVPVFFISCLNVLVFLLPVECGERVSYAITVFLAIDVYMTIVVENMPKNSKHMAIICYLLLLNVGHSTVICFETIICLVTYYREGQVPNLMTRIFFRKPCGIYKWRKIHTEGTKVTNKVKPTDHEDKKDHSLEKLDVDAHQDEEKNSKISWRDVSYKLDKIFGLGAVIFLISFVVIFMIFVAFQ
ncbi:neuronal acetylcholine receptor subunit alpha-6-like [Mercenaria mercenaria]|uniref:neuronal acetylcholine receptor subunit alpha-6-like n=1 Tax=Mercenaria mercenaria TaxID=6596 RepID=UPI00234F25DF|nr:neuronal acetylcholine receptor subunit alpha-6-like [Mercenaria mercenaria]